MVYDPGPLALVVARFNPHHGSDGKFATGSGNGGGDVPSDGTEGPENVFDAPYAGLNLNDDGSSRFSAAYREKYGTVIEENGVGPNSEFAVARTDKGAFHVADDRAGTERRQVLEEFGSNNQAAKELSDGVWSVAVEGGPSHTTKSGIRVDRAPSGGASITWTTGNTTVFTDFESRDLAEALEQLAS